MEYLTLVKRYRKAQTDVSRNTVIAELKQLHNSTSSQVVRIKAAAFLSSINAWGKKAS